MEEFKGHLSAEVVHLLGECQVMSSDALEEFVEGCRAVAEEEVKMIALLSVFVIVKLFSPQGWAFVTASWFYLADKTRRYPREAPATCPVTVRLGDERRRRRRPVLV